MKIRMGFVSNSSSSSFCVITTDEIFKDACKAATAEQAYLAEELFVLKDFEGGKIRFCAAELGSPAGNWVDWRNTEWDEENTGRGGNEEQLMYDFVKVLENVSPPSKLIIHNWD